jgi:type IV secretory pathway VirB6-like protein
MTSLQLTLMITIAVPLVVVVAGLSVLFHVYATYLSNEPRCMETLRFTRQLGVVSVVLPAGAVTALIGANLDGEPHTLLIGVMTGLALTAVVPTMVWDQQSNPRSSADE